MITFNDKRHLDVIAMGRSTVDIYALDIGLLEHAHKFAKYLGGSPANTAAAMAKLGLKVGFIGKVSQDGMGRFVKQYLADINIDVSHILDDEEGHKTAITIGEIKEEGKCNCIMYRDNCADLYLRPEDISAEYIAGAKALLVSGTSLSHSPAREAVFTAMRFAEDSDVRIIFDPDFREGTWDSLDEAAVYMLEAMRYADIVIGTRDELALPVGRALGKDNLTGREIADFLLKHGTQLVDVKDGRNGSTVYTANEEIPSPSYHVQGVVKTFGAGDAYAAGFISALIEGKDLFFAQKQGAAAAAITIKGHSCSDASPVKEELLKFMQEQAFSQQP